MSPIFLTLTQIALISAAFFWESNNKKMDQSKLTRKMALEYFAAYAKYENQNLNDCIKIDSENKLRGDIGAAELEYRENEKILIVRGLVNKDIGIGSNLKFKSLFLDTLFKLNNNPPFEMAGGKFEFDPTAYELQEDYPERINIRLDFTTPVNTKTFVKKVDALMNVTYSFKANEYQPIYDEIVEIVHPSK